MSETILAVLSAIGAVPSLNKVLMLVAAMPLALVALERVFPARPRPAVGPRSRVLNLTYWFVNPLFTQIASKFAVCLVCLAACLALGWPVDDSLLDGFGPLARQPLLLQALEMVVIGDFIDYWTHRFFHTTRFWRFHAVHHSAEHMTWHASARMHPVNDLVTRTCQVVPIVLMGFSVKAILLVVPMLVFFVVILHSNLNWDYGPLRWVLVSPLYHRWHHTSDAEGQDKNFAGIFPVWDLVFGTAHFPRREPVRFGVNHEPPPETFWGQFLYPFRALGARPPVPPAAPDPPRGAGC